jgi:cytochrome o ubiquinol oxidase subunit 2
MTLASLGSLRLHRLTRLTPLLATLLLAGCKSGVLDPAGPVGASERVILFDALAIMLAIVIPTMAATVAFAWWFRASNKRAVYRPTWEYSGRLELLVWSIPALVVLFLGGIAWISSHDLDPYKALPSASKPLEVEVVSLDWKWLFIYPQQNVASVNHLVLPAGVPVHFRLTSASVMNSFFVPQLGSQIYTMAGMATQLNLMADQPGSFDGLSAQFSGDGFSDMRFTVDATSPDAFAKWVGDAQHGDATLDEAGFKALTAPSSKVAPTTYHAVSAGLFDQIISMASNSVPPVAANAASSAAQSASKEAQVNASQMMSDAPSKAGS